MGISAMNPVALDDVLTRADVWRGNALAQGSAAGCTTGYAELDAQLPGGGWPRGALVEILLAAAPGLNVAGVGEVSLLLPALARHTRNGGFAALIAPALAVHAPAWAAAGVELSRLILVTPAREAHQDTLWAAEQTLRSGAVGFALAWLPQAEAGSLKRLQRAAETGGSCAVVFRPAPCAGQSSPAALRLLVSGAGEGASVSIVKRRGPPLARPIPVAVARPRCITRRARATEFAALLHTAPLCA
ncbi:MAG: translesion DNA synthesis-associated protein ImuA [Rhodocyclaceae bacterium]